MQLNTIRPHGHLVPGLDDRLRDGLEATFQAAQSQTVVDQMWTRADFEHERSPPKRPLTCGFV
jgi:hypothetical protein